MSEVFERPAEVFNVNPLPSAGRISAVGKKTYPERDFLSGAPTAIKALLSQSESPVLSADAELLHPVCLISNQKFLFLVAVVCEVAKIDQTVRLNVFDR